MVAAYATSTLKQLGAAGLFAGRHFIELGGGDGRNGWAALNYGSSTGAEAGHYTTVELESWRDQLAGHNAERLGLRDKVSRHIGDAVAWVQGTGPESFDRSVVFACLPQVPADSETASTADGVIAQELFGDVGEIRLGELTVAQAGLTLVAASLKALRSKVTPESGLDALYVLSDRLTDEIKAQLFRATGWRQADVYTTEKPVPQDIDTSVAVFANTDDGQRFYDSQGKPLTARAAEERRRRALQSGGHRAAAALSAGYPHHYVSIHHLIPDNVE